MKALASDSATGHSTHARPINRVARCVSVALTAALGLAGCSSQATGLLAPVNAPEGTDRVNMVVATTRAPSEDPAMLFSGDRGEKLSYSNIVVSIPPEREVGSVQWPRSSPGNPATDFVAVSSKPLDQRQLLDWFKSASGKSRRVFVFVHGYNNRFDKSVLRFAQLAHDTDANAAPVLFSWPSRGRLLDYKRDHDNATYSRSDLATLLQTAVDSPAVSEIAILAHSMGSWVAVEAVKQLALRKGGVPRKITNLILASPDLDVGVFRQQITDMGPRRPQVTLFVSQSDRALQVSRILTRGMTRLGGIDLTREEYQDQLGPLDKVTVLDLTELRSNDGINHALFAQSPDVVRLIGGRLIQGQVVTDSDLASPLAAAESLGSAAGMVISAPIFLFDAASP